MLLGHPAHEGRTVRLSYCLNLHPADSLEGLYSGLGNVTEPLHARLAPGREFAVGMYLPATLARRLASDADALRELRAWLGAHGLDPSTFNAFPYGGFAHVGLKEGVFAPEWWSAERLQYTLDVAQVAARLLPALGARRHISISTHTGAHSSRVLPVELDSTRRTVFANWVAIASQLARIEREQGTRIVLSAEPEPRSLTETCAALSEVFAREHELRREQPESQAAIARHLGVCLDTCHAAVEFEPADARWRAGLAASGAGVGKLQFTSALAVLDPQGNEFGRRALLELDEARYLHQVTGQGPDAVARAGDLGELRAGWAEPQSAWHACTEWRCHFHVPVDLDALGASGLATTRDYADRVLTLHLAAPELWPSDELQVEIETYTWDVLPREARGVGELVDGLEREYRHVLGVLAAAGWTPA